MHRNRRAGSTKSSSTTFIIEDDMVCICRCGFEAETIVCWFDENAGRRLYVCCREKYGDGCGWKAWKDPKMSEHAKHVICRLLRRINSLEEKIANDKKIAQELRDREKKF
ncbi:unnamed protein product [Prunus armeniaca]|uniref:Zinc finger GRF-type domain-containing protein n=1 Tax=Prunus armeniaca TaxID=36596 RepID=A0A6J5WLG9_PRUAR|nr:unnamed protein product [Prunus armeniaca]CAB4299088.1 unnamed protein product [Prunus armeniaca]